MFFHERDWINWRFSKLSFALSALYFILVLFADGPLADDCLFVFYCSASKLVTDLYCTLKSDVFLNSSKLIDFFFFLVLFERNLYLDLSSTQSI